MPKQAPAKSAAAASKGGRTLGTPNYIPEENAACALAALEASESKQTQPACDLTAEAQKRYPAQLDVVTDEHGWSQVKVKGKVWTKELSKEVRPKADVWDRWNSTIKPYLINVIQPLYQSLLVDTGGKTKSKPSGTNAAQLETKLKQLLYAQTAKPKKKAAKKKMEREATFGRPWAAGLKKG